MDPLLQVAAAGLAGAVAGALIGAVAAWIVARMSRDEARKAREDARLGRLEDRQEARHARFADRKLTLAADLLVAADRHKTEANNQVASKYEIQFIRDEGDEVDDTWSIPNVGPTDPVRYAFQALDLVAPAVSEAAAALYTATLPLGGLAASHGRHDRGPVYWSTQWQQANDRWTAARHSFVEAVRADLGVNPEA